MKNFRIRTRIKRLLSCLLAVIMTITSIPIYTYADTEYLDTLAGWKVSCAWSNMSHEYVWQEDEDEIREVRLVTSYRIECAERDFNPGDIVFYLPGIGSANRGDVLEAAQVGSGTTSTEWEYTWDEQTDTYTVRNLFTLEAGGAMSGGFGITWDLKARDLVNGYEQERGPVFSINGEGSISMEPLRFAFQSERDLNRMNMWTERLSASDWDAQDKNYVWYNIKTDFDTTLKARSVYKSSYFITVEVPDHIDPSSIAVKGSNLIEKDGKYGFYVFKDLYEDELEETYTKQVGFLKPDLEGAEVQLHGHLDRLFNDDSEWVTAEDWDSTDDMENVDDMVTITVDDYRFEYDGYGYHVDKQAVGGYETVDHREPSLYANRLEAVNIYNGKVVEYTITGSVERRYVEDLEETIQTYSLRGQSASPANASPSDAKKTSGKTVVMKKKGMFEDGLPEGISDWNDVYWLENGLLDSGVEEPEEQEDESLWDMIKKVFAFLKNPGEQAGLLMTAYAATPSAPVKVATPDDSDYSVDTADIDDAGVYSLILGDDHLAILQRKDTMRPLENNEYSFTHVTVPAYPSAYSYTVYGASERDAATEDYRVIGTGSTIAGRTIKFPTDSPDGPIRAFYIRVDGLDRAFELTVRAGVRLHLDWAAEMERPEEERPDHEGYLANFSYIRALYTEDDEVYNDCMGNADCYQGEYAQTMMLRDLDVHGELLLRGYSNVYLREPVTNVSADSYVTPFEGTPREGYLSTVTSYGHISADNSGVLSRFSLYSEVPEGTYPILEDGSVSVRGSALDLNGEEVSDFTEYVSFEQIEVNGATFIVADFQFRDHALDIKGPVSVSFEYPISLSYVDFKEHGSQYDSTTYVMVHDYGVERVSGQYIMTDILDLDRDGDMSEKVAYRRSLRIMRDPSASEWREYGSAYVITPYSDDAALETVIKKYDSTADEAANAGSYYEYEMSFGASSYAGNIVFYDHLDGGAVIENADGTTTEIPSEWHGEFLGVDATEAEALGFKVTVYYSTSEGAGLDLNGAEWTTEPPADLSTVRTVAVRLNTENLENGLLKSNEVASVSIKMRAPEVQDDKIETVAVNQATIVYDSYDMVGAPESSFTLTTSPTYLKIMDTVGAIRLQKFDVGNPIGTDADGNLRYATITGGSYMLYDADKNPLFTEALVPDSLGRMDVPEMPYGTYYWKEISGTSGYTVKEEADADGMHAFYLDVDTGIIEMEYKRIPGTVTLTKVDRDQPSLAPISGAAYELFTEDGSIVFTDDTYQYDEAGTNRSYLTGADGTFTLTGLPWGSYYFLETEAPEGYELSTEKVEFVISRTQQEIAVTGRNREIVSSVRLTLQDEVYGTGLKDGRFELYMEKTGGDPVKVRENLKTNAAGELIVEGLFFGTYLFKEIQPPRGYLNQEWGTSFEITPSHAGEMVDVIHTNGHKPGSVTLYKTSEDGQPLEGAVYSLYLDGVDEPVGDGFATGADGYTAVVDGLEWGIYSFVETSAPAGYQLDATPVVFDVSAATADLLQTVKATDKRVRGSIHLTKLADGTTDKLLSETVFSLYKLDGTLIASNITSDADGTFYVSDIDWGSYYLLETAAHSGYGLSDEKIRFSVNRENCTVTQELFSYSTVLKGELIVEAEMDADEYHAAFGAAPTFIYRIAGTDIKGNEHVWFRQISLSGEQTAGRAVITDVPYGTYEVMQMPSSRYETETAGGAGTATIDEETRTASFLFENRVRQYEKFSEMTALTSIITAGKKLTSIVVTYKGPEVITSNTASDYTFTNEDMDLLAVYDDGTTKVLKLGDEGVTIDPATVSGGQNTGGAGHTVTVTYTEDGITRSGSFSVVTALQEPAKVVTITYDANGGYFNNDTSQSVNEVVYAWETIVYDNKQMTKVSHTRNLDDENNVIDTKGYPNNERSLHVVTIPGAESVTVEITYRTETNWDWVSVFGGDITPTDTNYADSVFGDRLTGDPGGTRTVTIPGDTAQFYFYSDGSVTKYGYFATVTGYVKGEYKEVVCVHKSGTLQTPENDICLFDGWYTADGEPYTPESEPEEDITVYAKWHEPQATFLPGPQVNAKMKTLAAGSGYGYDTTNKTITGVKAGLKPDLSEMTDKNIVSTADSECEIYMWYEPEETSIYWWSKDKEPALNVSANYMFHKLEALEDISGLATFDASGTTHMSNLFNYCKALPDLDALSAWETDSLTALNYSFEYCYALTNVDGLKEWNVTLVENMSAAFDGCKALNDISGLSGWETTALKHITTLFMGCTSLTSLEPLRGWDTDQVTSLSCTFQNCSALTSIEPLSAWDTGKVSILSGTFQGCSNLLSLEGLNGWNISAVTNMTNAFRSCSKISSLEPLRLWKTGLVTEMKYMFEACSALEDITGLEEWDVSKVVAMEQLFKDCTSLESLTGLESWKTGSAKTINAFCSGCVKLTDITAFTNWDTSSVTNVSSLVNNCQSLVTLDGLQNWDTSNVTSMAQFAHNCYILSDITALTNWDTSKVTSMNLLFGSCRALTTLSALANWDTSRVTSLSQGFLYCHNLEDVSGLQNWDTTSMTNMYMIFHGGKPKLKVLDLSGWDASAATNFYQIFYPLSSIEAAYARTQADADIFNANHDNSWQFVPKVRDSVVPRLVNGKVFNSKIPEAATSIVFTDETAPAGADLTDVSYYGDGSVVSWLMDTTCYVSTQVEGTKVLANRNLTNMFSGKSSLVSIDADMLDVSGAEKMGDMFKDCSGLVDLSFNGWDTSKVTDMSNMFAGCTGLEAFAELSALNTSAVKDMRGMFKNCSGLSVLDLTSFDMGSVKFKTDMMSGTGTGSCVITCTAATEAELLDGTGIAEGSFTFQRP